MHCTTAGPVVECILLSATQEEYVYSTRRRWMPAGQNTALNMTGTEACTTPFDRHMTLTAWCRTPELEEEHSGHEFVVYVYCTITTSSCKLSSLFRFPSATHFFDVFHATLEDASRFF
jgi:hypothetical protein